MENTAGRLEEALEKYKRSQQFGVERAAVHIRNVRAFILYVNILITFSIG